MLHAFASTTAGMIGLFGFLAFFAVVAFMLLRPGAREKARDHARIPFKED